MGKSLEEAVTRHYTRSDLDTRSDLAERIVGALADAGLASGRLEPEQLAAVDEFHIGGREATEHAVAKMQLRGDEHVLDVGCGVGGAARYLASVAGCRVTGIDLTPSFIEVARLLTERTGLADKVDFETANALSMPFEAAAFDAALSLHVAMNIKDREGLCREIARVLKPGARFCLYDVMQGPNRELRFPVPWAETAETSHLTTPEETKRQLAGAGFEVEAVDDRTGFGIEFFRQRLAANEAKAPPLGLHLIIGRAARTKFENLLHALDGGSVMAVVMLARKRR